MSLLLAWQRDLLFNACLHSAHRPMHTHTQADSHTQSDSSDNHNIKVKIPSDMTYLMRARMRKQAQSGTRHTRC